jgi:hypothetical protein
LAIGQLETGGARGQGKAVQDPKTGSLGSFQASFIANRPIITPMNPNGLRGDCKPERAIRAKFPRSFKLTYLSQNNLFVVGT